MKEKVKTEKAKPEKIKPDICLLLKMPDNRHFFTYENNFPMLVEFGRKFASEISLVKAPTAEVVELEELVQSICVQPVDAKVPTYETLEIKLSPNSPSGKTKGEQLAELTKHIKSELLRKNTVKIDDLLSKFENVPKTAIVKSFSNTRRDLRDSGYEIIKIKPGHYQGNGLAKRISSWDDEY
jgi:hypothetical protein